jgi:hypothetical protein
VFRAERSSTVPVQPPAHGGGYPARNCQLQFGADPAPRTEGPHDNHGQTATQVVAADHPPAMPRNPNPHAPPSIATLPDASRGFRSEFSKQRNGSQDLAPGPATKRVLMRETSLFFAEGGSSRSGRSCSFAEAKAGVAPPRLRLSRERGENAEDAARAVDSDEAQLWSSLVRADPRVLIFGGQSDRGTVLAVP